VSEGVRPYASHLGRDVCVAYDKAVHEARKYWRDGRIRDQFGLEWMSCRRPGTTEIGVSERII